MVSRNFGKIVSREELPFKLQLLFGVAVEAVKGERVEFEVK
jgi:hypothetical protein